MLINALKKKTLETSCYVYFKFKCAEINEGFLKVWGEMISIPCIMSVSKSEKKIFHLEQSFVKHWMGIVKIPLCFFFTSKEKHNENKLWDFREKVTAWNYISISRN